jgi:hypothetical protein
MIYHITYQLRNQKKNLASTGMDFCIQLCQDTDPAGVAGLPKGNEIQEMQGLLASLLDVSGKFKLPVTISLIQSYNCNAILYLVVTNCLLCVKLGQKFTI